MHGPRDPVRPAQRQDGPAGLDALELALGAISAPELRKPALVRTAGVTSGSVHDATVMHRLIRADDTAVYGDKGYASGAKKRAAETAGVLWAVKEKATPGHGLTLRQRARNRRFGKVRAKVEHVFRVLKCQFGYRKVRYRGLAKNAAHVFSLLALANLYLARRTIASA